MIRELAEFEKLSHACIATEELLRRHLFGERADGTGISERVEEALVAEVDGCAVVAYAIFLQNFFHILGAAGDLSGGYLRQTRTHRRQGIGKAMLRCIWRAGGRNGATGRLEWSVLDWNAPAIAFYKSLGWGWQEWTMFRLTGDALGGGRGFPAFARIALNDDRARPQRRHEPVVFVQGVHVNLIRPRGGKRRWQRVMLKP